MQSSLATTIVSALQLQLNGLTSNLKQLGGDEQHAMITSPRTPQPRVTNEIFAAAIKASLDPQFDSLDKEASDLTLRIPHSARQTNVLCSAASPRIAADIADELMPEIKEDITSTIDNILSARINGFKQPEADFPKSTTRKAVQIDSRHQSKDSHSTSHADDSGNSQIRGATLSLPIDALRQASSSSLVAMTTRHSDIMRNRQPEKAFVVNFRRLVEIQKVLSLLHLIIKSTAIATLTLVSCGAWTDYLTSCLFVGSVLGIYAVHEMRHDGMDIEDYKALSGLMEDDNGTYRGANGEAIDVQNPNRLLKALTLSKKSRAPEAIGHNHNLSCLLSFRDVGSCILGLVGRETSRWQMAWVYV
jgi:hypothetical protein